MLLPQDHTVLVRQTSKWGQVLLLSLVSLGATAFATAWFYRIDEVITVQGRLVPKKGGVEVQSPVTGQMDEVLVKNGEQVAKGEILMRFDVKAAREQEATITKQLNIEKKRLNDQLESNIKRQDTLKRNIKFTEKLLTRLIPLEAGGAISEVQILQESNRLEAQRDELIQVQAQSEKIKNDNRSRIEQLKGQLSIVADKLRNEVIIAPISGIIFDLQPDNNKYVTTNAQALLKIVPKGKLGAEVNIVNRDIGFIKKGQEVKVRVDSFPYTEYGELSGKIKSIGADALPPNKLVNSYHFPVSITLNRSELKTREGIKVPLQAGMTITTNLKLRDRRLIELLSDLFTNRGESLKRLRQP